MYIYFSVISSNRPFYYCPLPYSLHFSLASVFRPSRTLLTSYVLHSFALPFFIIFAARAASASSFCYIIHPTFVFPSTFLLNILSFPIYLLARHRALPPLLRTHSQRGVTEARGKLRFWGLKGSW